MISKQNKSPMTPKKIVTIALSAIFFIAAYGGQQKQTQAQVEVEVQSTEIQTHSTDWVQTFDEAVSLSKSNGKPIMLVFSGSDWCSYCQLLEQEVFQTFEFQSWSSANVIKVMVDFPQHQNQSDEVVAQNHILKQHFAHHLKGYPTVLMIESSGAVIGRTGYVAGGPAAWISKADSIIQQPAHHLAVTSNTSR